MQKCACSACYGDRAPAHWPLVASVSQLQHTFRDCHMKSESDNLSNLADKRGREIVPVQTQN